MQNSQEKIEHELVAKRYYILQDEAVPEIQELHSVNTAIPLCNVVDWEGVTNDWHEEAPVKEMTAVIMPYETKFVHIPFKQFHGIMKNIDNMEETKRDGVEQTEEILHTKGGYECTIMEHPKTSEKLVIRECFDRWRLIEDDETEEEHKMRKKLLNAFKKRREKRGHTFHQSVSYDPEINEETGEMKMNRKGHTYYKNPPEVEEQEIEDQILDVRELGATIKKP